VTHVTSRIEFDLITHNDSCDNNARGKSAWQPPLHSSKQSLNNEHLYRFCRKLLLPFLRVHLRQQFPDWRNLSQHANLATS
jgi:hypothetical protein